MVPLNIALAVALLFFLCAPPFTDLLPFVAAHHSFLPIPPVARPLLLLTMLFLWFWVRTPGKWLLILARFALALPVVLVTSIPLLPDILLGRRWVITNGILFLAVPMVLALV